MCGTTRVPWVEVAAAITRLMGREAWVEAERLNVVVGQTMKPASTDCIDTPWPKLGAMFGTERPCAPRSGERTGPRVVTMPPGFAPVTELGARFASQPLHVVAPLSELIVPAAAPGANPSAAPVQQTPIGPPRATVQRVAGASSTPQTRWSVLGPDSDMPYEPAVAANTLHPQPEAVPTSLPAASAPSLAAAPALPDPVQVTAERPLAPTDDSPGASPPAPKTEAAGALVPLSQLPVEVADAGSRLGTLSSWAVTVRQADIEHLPLPVAYVSAMTGGHWLYFLLALLTASLAAVAIVVRWATRHASNAGIFGRSSSGGDLVVRRRYGVISLEDPEERILMDLRRTADQLRTNADVVLEDLKSAAPLRGVLRQELDLISTRLSDVPRAGSAPLPPRMLRQRYQGGIRELHRVIKIAEGAAASFSSAAYRPAVPTNRDEAYELLGVNDSVSDATLKKVVDALRMSWHPDHARDEADRDRREERTKQINVAWDLITGRRGAG